VGGKEEVWGGKELDVPAGTGGVDVAPWRAAEGGGPAEVEGAVGAERAALSDGPSCAGAANGGTGAGGTGTGGATRGRAGAALWIVPRAAS